MSDDKKSPPFYERRLFQGTAAVVALAAAVVALGGRIGDIIDDLFPPAPPRASWTEVVLNTSAIMGEHFGGKDETRLASAGQAIEKRVKELGNSGVGLRTTPANCKGNSEQLVGLANGTPDEVISEAQHQHPTGNSSIIDAVNGALNDFAREPMSVGKAKSKNIIVFTTGSARCPYDEVTEIAHTLAAMDPEHIPGVELFQLAPEGEGQAAAGARTRRPRSELVALSGPEGEGELKAITAVLSEYTTPSVHYVASPKKLYEEAEDAGKDAAKTAKQLEEERREEEEEGPSG
jgi:hypothetical protein